MLRIFLFLFLTALPVAAQEARGPMSLERLHEISQALDPEARVFGRNLEMTIADVPVLVVADPVADRMRAMVAIRSSDGLETEEINRLLQANFDTALDARYAIAQGKLWAVFIHPLSPLQKDQYISAIGQTVNLAVTYGGLYSGGIVTFGPGDSTGILRKRIEDLLKRGEEL